MSDLYTSIFQRRNQQSSDAGETAHLMIQPVKQLRVKPQGRTFPACDAQHLLHCQAAFSGIPQEAGMDRSGPRHLGGRFFQSGSCSPLAQLMSPPTSFPGRLGSDSIVSNTSLRSALGSVRPPPFVGIPRIGANRLHRNSLTLFCLRLFFASPEVHASSAVHGQNTTSWL